MQVLFIRDIPLVVKKIQGSIWQLLAVRWKAAKTLTYCILLWRLNALKKLGYSFRFPRSREGIKDCSLPDKSVISVESTPSPFEAGVLLLLLILLG